MSLTWDPLRKCRAQQFPKSLHESRMHRGVKVCILQFSSEVKEGSTKVLMSLGFSLAFEGTGFLLQFL